MKALHIMAIFNFTKERRKKYFKQMLVWTTGMLVVVPIFLVTFPYLIDMPLDKYGMSIWELLLGVYPMCSFFWLAGAVIGLLLHVFNPLTPTEMAAYDPVYVEQKGHHSPSGMQILGTVVGGLMYLYLAIACTLSVSGAAPGLGLIVGILFIVLGCIAMDQHIKHINRS